MLHFHDKNLSITVAELVNSASFQYGLTPFETVRVYSNNNCMRLLLVDEHITRFIRTLKIMNLKILYSHSEIQQRLTEIIKNLPYNDDYLIKIMGFTRENSWGKNSAVEVCYSVKIATRRMPGERPARILTSSLRRPRADIMPVIAKVGANYISSRLGQVIANEAGYDLAIFLNDMGCVEESSGAAILAADGDQYIKVKTMGGSLDSITLNYLTKKLRSIGHSVEERFTTLPDLYCYDALFLIGTSVEVLNIKALDHIVYDDRVLMAHSRLLLNLLHSYDG